MTVTAPITIARGAIKALLEVEFATDGFTIIDDKLHASLGRDGETRIGISPLQEVPVPADKNVMQYGVLVQFYGPWKDEINPLTQVDPAIVETFAERFKRALRTGDPKQPTAWFFSLVDLTYPSDPTGNISRFEARVTCYGENTSLIETTG